MHLAQHVVHEAGHGEHTAGRACGQEEIVHGERRGDVAAGPGPATANGGDDDDALDAVPLDGLGGGPRKASVGLLEAGGLEVGRNEPENGIRTLEGPVYHGRVAVGAFDDLDL